MNAAFIFVLLFLPAVLPAWGADKFKIASYSTVLTEIAQAISGDKVVVIALIKPGEDPHEYQPTPADLQKIADCRLILTSGKHLENYLSKVREATGGEAILLQVGDQLPSLKMEHSEDEGGSKTGVRVEDPHWWNSVLNVQDATGIIRDQIIKLDPDNKVTYEANATAYIGQLRELLNWAKKKVAELPRNQRKLVTSHDAFQYFAQEFGFTVLAVEGVSSESEASSRHVAELIDQIKKEKVKAIFVESSLNPKVTAEITSETGAVIGGVLYADGLGDGDAGTYAGMVKHNISTIVDALK
jgi:zinc/manganese transport system substrate-binding protein